MKTFVISVLSAFALVTAISQISLATPETGKAEEQTLLKTKEDIASYGIGLQIGKRYLKNMGFDINMESLQKGIQDGLSEEGKQLMPDNEIRDTLIALQKEIAEKQAKENKEKGEKFLQENQKKEGVVTLPSGLQYKILQKGTGATPKANDSVIVNYTGTTIDGKVFDSSVQRGKPAQFQANNVIKGWTEALLMMKVGSKWKLFIPADLAYGEKGAGGKIGPNETLIFEVELLDVLPSNDKYDITKLKPEKEKTEKDQKKK